VVKSVFEDASFLNENPLKKLLADEIGVWGWLLLPK
jgi:hypothetical protein